MNQQLETALVNALTAFTAVLAAEKQTMPSFLGKGKDAAEAKTDTKAPAADKKADVKVDKKAAEAAAEEAYAPVKAITLRVHKEKGATVLTALLKDFGCEKSAKELKSNQYGDYVAAAEKLLAGEEDVA